MKYLPRTRQKGEGNQDIIRLSDNLLVNGVQNEEVKNVNNGVHVVDPNNKPLEDDEFTKENELIEDDDPNRRI